MPIQIADAYRYSLFALRQTGLIFNLPAPDPDLVQLPEGISLCMIVKNEERFLAECLESVKDVVDEINIIDTGSTDRTVEIARSYGANVQFREWRNDFAWARNEALEMATRRWTLVLDADEELEGESKSFMRSLRTTPCDATCVYINIVNLIDDASGMGTMSHRLIRVFPTNPVLRYGGVIHESLARVDDGEMGAVLSPITILHKGYTVEMLTSREKDARNKPLLQRAYDENGDDSFSLFNFGNSAICSGNAQTGIEILERMLATATSPKLYFPLAYLMLGQTYCESLGEYDKAVEILDKGLEKFPKDAGIIFTKGQVLSKLGKTAEARTLFEDALALREHMASTVMTDEEIFEWKVYYAMAGTYEVERKYEDAIGFIDKALQNKPNSFHLQRTKARLLENISRFYDAELMFRAMAEADPQRGQVELVNFFLRRRRYAQAIAIAENEIDPGANAHVVASLNIGAARAIIETKQGDPVPFLEAALRQLPGSGQALSLLESVLIERGDTAGVEKLQREELDVPCTRPEDFVRRSFRFLALDRTDDARDIAEQGLQVDPNNSELRFNLALALLRSSDEARALHEFGRVDPHSVETFTTATKMRAALMLKNGAPDDALAAFERAFLVAEPDADTVLEAARNLLAADARPQARTLLEAHLDLDNRVALELATIYLQDGDFAGAGRIAAASLK